MVKFERSRERNDRENSRGNSGDRVNRGRDSRGGGNFRGGGRSGGNRSFDRGRPSFGNRGRRDTQMTKVTCASCGNQCEVPFKPTAGKPVYCSNCFGKNGGGSLGSVSREEFEKINEKLDKIIKALKI